MIPFAGSAIALLVVLFRVDLNGLEAVGLLVAAYAAKKRPFWGSRQFRYIETWFGAWARRRVLAVVSVGILTVVLRLAVLPIAPTPQPVIVDEFSHRLLAETLLLGRAGNPTHPMWAHFETMQVIQKPTYASIYFPGQGVFLALGKLVGGSLWAGVVLSVAFMCMAVCWALQGWLPPEWALLGALIAVLRYGLFSYWMNSYWGGAVGGLGGALVLGAWPRIRHRGTLGPSLLMALGLALLAVSRPFESLGACIPVACAMAVWAVSLRGRALWRAVRCVAAPIICVFMALAGLLGSYNARVTGNALRLPYAVNQQTYGWPLTLPWFRVELHRQASKAMQDYYQYELDAHAKVVHAGENVFLNLTDGLMLWTFFVGPALSVFLVFLPRTIKDRRVRLPLAMCTGTAAVMAIEGSRYPHYFAPAMAAFLVVLLQSARHMRAQGARRSPAMLAMFRSTIAVVVFVVAARASVPVLQTADTGLGHYMSWCCGRQGNLDRAKLLERLDRMPGDHLVIVHYGPKHKYMYEFVYNEPQIDRAKVVWARDMGDRANQELIQYFSGRRVWLLEVDDEELPPVLKPYPGQRPMAQGKSF